MATCSARSHLSLFPAYSTLLFIFTLLLHATLVCPSTTSQASPRGKFKAAVYEHALIQPPDPMEVVSREEALRVMRQNLDVYAVRAAEAERQGADILVFPEDGLYGFRFIRKTLEPYLEFIPDPTVVSWVPCDDPARFPNTEVQQALSCLAKNHSLYLVANMGDIQPCGPQDACGHAQQDDDDDAHDHFQYNTDVAFDPKGQLVARYHKQHLFFEAQFDTPKTVELSTFDTPFGRWGMFTCFDILFHDPAVALIEREGIANIAFPTAWMDALPLLASVQFHSAFARGMGVNFLAANLHLPEHRFQGSGVYTPRGMAAFVHNATVSSEPRLIVTEIDILDRPQPERRSRTREIRSILEVSKDTADTDSVVVVEQQVTTGQPEHEFESELFHDMFTFVPVVELEGSLHVCHNNICCYLNYSMTRDSQNPDFFALGAFDGLHTYEGRYYLQICALVRCASQQHDSCGSPTNQSATLFHSLSMRGELQTDYVYPEVLLTTDTQQLRLAKAEEWTFPDGVIRSEAGFSYPVLSVALFGRWYARDGLPSASPDASVAVAMMSSARTVLVVVCAVASVSFRHLLF